MIFGELKGLLHLDKSGLRPCRVAGRALGVAVPTRAAPNAIRMVRHLFGGALVAALFLCIASYEPIKTAGFPPRPRAPPTAASRFRIGRAST